MGRGTQPTLGTNLGAQLVMRVILTDGTPVGFCCLGGGGARYPPGGGGGGYDITGPAPVLSPMGGGSSWCMGGGCPTSTVMGLLVQLSMVGMGIPAMGGTTGGGGADDVDGTATVTGAATASCGAGCWLGGTTAGDLGGEDCTGKGALQRAERRHLGLDLKLFSLCTFCAISKWRRSSRTAAVAGFLKVVSRPLIGSHAARFSSAPFRFFHAIEMPGDSRLKPSTQRAFGSRKKRAWNKKAPATSAPSAAELESRPDPLDLPGTSTDDTVGPSSTSETLRVDAAYYSTAEQAQRVERSAQTKTVLSGKSATQRKFDLLGVSAECQTGDAGTDFLLVDMKVLNNFFAQAKCDKCDAKSLSVRKATDKEYGLAVKLIFSCSSCDFEKKQFSSPRVSGTATITPFEVNMRAMKGIQMIGKGVTALSDFCACMNLSHRGLHHKTFQGHLKV
ncbi:hypothetical protein HPB52_003462 [Rhipicephalus sanguineus]|uniref:Mutator-like transposase domain-containing protein n=1 Tax=Rhipicephalus sanguineus TaxID=34632 RepID=A0A9D4Q9L9_RHISA|nr:hypothetical protein HPB52_003462 [Rhipicephalus sanguineus]